MVITFDSLQSRQDYERNNRTLLRGIYLASFDCKLVISTMLEIPMGFGIVDKRELDGWE